jgi:hypothetical protein
MTPLQRQYYKWILSRNFKELNKVQFGGGKGNAAVPQFPLCSMLILGMLSSGLLQFATLTFWLTVLCGLYR